MVNITGGNISEKTIGRLSRYRRLLNELRSQGSTHIFSHQLASLAGVGAPQVRRDMMVVGYIGSPVRGYEIDQLRESIGRFLDAPSGQKAALVGVGNLGRAILAFFAGRRPKLEIVAAFDSDPEKTGRLILGCPCHPIGKMGETIVRESIDIGIITVPATDAQKVAGQLTNAGIKGILNFAPTTIKAPSHIFVESIDMTTALEKVAYFARQGPKQEVSTNGNR